MIPDYCDSASAPSLLNANNTTPLTTVYSVSTYSCSDGYVSSGGVANPYFTCAPDTPQMGKWSPITYSCQRMSYHSYVTLILTKQISLKSAEIDVLYSTRKIAMSSTILILSRRNSVLLRSGSIIELVDACCSQSDHLSNDRRHNFTQLSDELHIVSELRDAWRKMRGADTDRGNLDHCHRNLHT